MTLPELHLADWRPTKDTLHLYCQIVGKVRLATTPPRNQWWNVPLYVDVRGLTTRRLHHNDTTFQIDFDFVDHALLVRTHDGRVRSFELAEGVPVADFDSRLHEALSELGVDVAIREQPFGLPIKTPFPEDREHAAWDRSAIERFGDMLDWSDGVFEEFSGWFNGKTSPVHLFWHGLDLAVTRFSGRRAPPFRGSVPGVALAVMQEAYSHEVSSAGFWPGSADVDASFYSYAYPAPPGFAESPVRPDAAHFSEQLGEFLLPYDAVRTDADPEARVLEFLQSTYDAAARTAQWDRAALECPFGKPGPLPKD